MNDKKRKYDFSNFIKNGGKPKRKYKSPSVYANASVVNDVDRQRMLNNLNQEIAEMNEMDRNARNAVIKNRPENPEGIVPPANNNDDSNNGNLGEISAKQKSEEEINAEIAASENRLAELMNQFSLESHRNRPEFNSRLANVNAPGAADMNHAFDRNNKRRRERESAKIKKDREERRREKEEGVEANKEGREGTGRVRRKEEGQSASQKAPTEEEIADRFFYLLATSDRPSDLSRNQLQQFSQDPLQYVNWARGESGLLSGPQRREFRNMTSEQLLARLPRNLQQLFERIRSESAALNALLRLRPARANLPELTVLEVQEGQKAQEAQGAQKELEGQEGQEAQEAQRAQKELEGQEIKFVNVEPIIVNTRGVPLPPNQQKNLFNVEKTRIKKEEEETKPSPKKLIKIEDPEIVKKKISNEAKKLSNETKKLDELHTQKILRNKEKIISKITKKLEENKFQNLEKKEYIEYLLAELKDQIDKTKIIGLILQIEKIEKELQNIDLNKIYKNKDQFISKIKDKLKKYEFNNEEKEEIEELIKKIDSLKEEKSSQIVELMDNLKKIIDKKNEELHKKWLNNTSKLVELANKGPLKLKSLTIPKLLKELNNTPPDQEEKIEQLTSMINKLKNQELKDKELKDEELSKKLKNMNNSKKVSEQYKNEIERLKKSRKNKEEREEKLSKNLKNMNNSEEVSEQYKNEIERLKKSRKNKEEREEEERIRKEEEEKERSRDPKEILKKLKEQQERILTNKKARKKQIKEHEKNETLLSLRLKSKGFKKLTLKEEKLLEEKEKKIEELEKELEKLEKKSKELKNKITELKPEKSKKDKQKNRFDDEEKQEEINIKISNKNTELIDKILKTQQELHKADTEEKKSELRKIKTELFKKIESSKTGNSHKYLKEVRDTISRGFKELNLQDLKNKYAELFKKGEEMIESSNKNKKLELQKEVDNLLMKLYTDNDYDKKNRQMLIDNYKNFVNRKEIERGKKRFLENIENSKKKIQEKYNSESEEKNLFKRYLKNSLSLVNEKNKDKLQKLYKKLNTEKIKIYPKNLKKLEKKFKKIEEMKVKKENRTTNELPTPNIKQVQTFKPKSVISPWAKKNSSQVVNNTVKPTTQTFPKDSSKIIKGKSYRNAVKPTTQTFPKDSSKEDNSGYKRIPTRNEIKIKKSIKKLPSKTIKIKDIKSAISSIQNKEIKKQLSGLLDQKLISITRK